jgi:hypothetical protein
MGIVRLSYVMLRSSLEACEKNPHLVAETKRKPSYYVNNQDDFSSARASSGSLLVVRAPRPTLKGLADNKTEK